MEIFKKYKTNFIFGFVTIVILIAGVVFAQISSNQDKNGTTLEKQKNDDTIVDDIMIVSNERAEIKSELMGLFDNERTFFKNFQKETVDTKYGPTRYCGETFYDAYSDGKNVATNTKEKVFDCPEFGSLEGLLDSTRLAARRLRKVWKPLVSKI